LQTIICKKSFIFNRLNKDGPVKSNASRALRGASRECNVIISELCRFIPACKAVLSRHLPVKGQTIKQKVLDARRANTKE